MEKSNVNNLNGIPNFGHGFPEDNEEATSKSEESTGGIQEGEVTLGEQAGTEGEEQTASSSDSA